MLLWIIFQFSAKVILFSSLALYEKIDLTVFKNFQLYVAIDGFKLLKKVFFFFIKSANIFFCFLYPFKDFSVSIFKYILAS